MSINKKFSVGLIGLGNWGKIIAKKFLNDSRYTLSHIVTKSGNVLEEFQNIPHSSDYKDVTNNSNIDLVYIAVPPNLHQTLVFDCIYKDKNIIVDKPLCDNLNDLEEVKGLVSRWRNDKLFLVNYTHLFNQTFLDWVTKLTQLNLYKSTIYVNVRGPVEREYLSRTLDYGSHVVSLMQYLLKQFNVTEPYWTVFKTERAWAQFGMENPFIIGDWGHMKERDVSIHFINSIGDTETWRDDRGFDSLNNLLTIAFSRIDTKFSNLTTAYNVGKVLY
jgi:predicted dehydrogenase